VHELRKTNHCPGYHKTSKFRREIFFIAIWNT